MAIGLCRRGPFAGVYIDAMSQNDFRDAIAQHPDWVEYIYFQRWEFQPPALNFYSEMAQETEVNELPHLSAGLGYDLGNEYYQFKYADNNLEFSDNLLEFNSSWNSVINLLDSWDVDWIPEELEDRASNFLFHGSRPFISPRHDWYWSSWEEKWWRRTPALMSLLPQNFFAGVIGESSQLTLRTKRVAFSFVRDLLLPGEWTQRVSRFELLEQEPSLVDVEHELSARGLTLAVVPRWLDSGVGNFDSMSRLVVSGAEAIASLAKGLYDSNSDHFRSTWSWRFSAAVNSQLKRRGFDRAGAGVLAAVLEQSSVCLAVLPRGKSFVSLRDDPWYEIRQLPPNAL